MISTKICGIRDQAALDAAIEGGATKVGFMFYPPSPRHIEIEAAAKLAREAGGRVALVGVFVDPHDEDIEAVLEEVPLTHIQLHGSEDGERIAKIRETFNRQVIKAVAIADERDVTRARKLAPAADILLFDAKPPKDEGFLPGGNALSFDWRLIAQGNWGKPWMLSGGLTAENVAEAITASGARAVDVSSGVEREKGVKDPAMIRAFLDAVSRVETPDQR